VPHLLHVVPVLNDSVLDGVPEPEHSSLLHGLLSDVDFVLIKSNHNAWDLGSAHNSGEHRPRGIISCKSSLADSRAIIDDHSGYLFFHFKFLLG